MKHKKIIQKIVDLYNSQDGSAGGYGHIVFDDGNIEKYHIKWCISEAENKAYSEWICEDTRLKSLLALKALLPLCESEIKYILKRI